MTSVGGPNQYSNHVPPAPPQTEEKKNHLSDPAQTSSVGSPGGKSYKRVGQRYSPTAIKINYLFRSFIASLVTVFHQLKKFGASIANTLNEKMSKIVSKIFPRKTDDKILESKTETESELRERHRKEAVELGIGNYIGETLTNAPRREGTTKQTVQEELQLVWRNLDQQKNMKTLNPSLIHPSLEDKPPIQVPVQFFKDYPRQGRMLESGILFNARDPQAKQKEQEAALYAACENLITRFTSNGFLNIASLMVQTLTADLIVHLHDSAKNAATNTDASIIFGSRSDLKSLYDIREEGDKVHIMLNYIFAATNLDKMEETLGYITVQRDIVLDRIELTQPWREEEIDKIASKAEVIDRYSPFCETVEEAEKYFNEFTKVKK